jgi:hypothetical protein
MFLKSNFLNVLALLSLVASVPACSTGEEDSESAEGAASSRPRILLFGAGGWNSCNGGGPAQSRIAANMDNLAKQLRSFADVSVITQCLRALPPSKLAAQTEVSINGQVAGRVPAREIPRFVNDSIVSYRPTQVYTIGHSYGGWTVIDLLESGLLSRKVDATFTLDPIDANDCVILDYATQSPSCQHSPVASYPRFGNRTNRIINIYQNDGRLHSTPINSPIAVNYETFVQHRDLQTEEARAEGAHRSIGSDPGLWGYIGRTIFERNGQNPYDFQTIAVDKEGAHTPQFDGDPVDIPQIDANLPPLDAGRSPGNGDSTSPTSAIKGRHICGQATERTRVCISADRRQMQVVTRGDTRDFTVTMNVTSMGNSSKLPGGTAYYARGDFSWMSDDINGQPYQLVRDQEVALAVHPSGNGLFSYRVMTRSGPAFQPLRNRRSDDPFAFEIID